MAHAIANTVTHAKPDTDAESHAVTDAKPNVKPDTNAKSNAESYTDRGAADRVPTAAANATVAPH